LQPQAPARFAFRAKIRKARRMTEDDALRAANVAYYRAFARRDAEAMARLWAQEGVSCVHPGWPPIFGREAILASYRDIFKNPFQDEIETSGETLIRAGNEGRIVCLERVGEALLVATNWFRLFDSEWRLVHHQASPLSAGSTQAKTSTTRH
jgi:uncharacterized protein (TIGR02246 family)